MSEIVGLNSRYRELGRLRMGERVDTGKVKNGRPVLRPTKLDCWRFTSTDWRLISKAADLYGGEPSRWDDAPGTVRQYQVTSEANDVPVMLPPEVALNQAMEAWTAGECLRRCDGQFEQITGAECLCQDEATPVCKPTTRLSVLLTDMPGLGVWRLESHGWYAARELVPMVRMAATFGAGTRFRLRIDPRQRQTKDAAGKTVTYLFGVPVLDTDLTPGQLLAEVAAPASVLEVAGVIQDQKSGAGSRIGGQLVAPGSADASPAPGDQSEARRQGPSDEGTTFDAHDRASDPTSDPPPVAPPRAGGSDPTSPTGPLGEGGRVGDQMSGGEPVDQPRRAVDPPPDPTSPPSTMRLSPAQGYRPVGPDSQAGTPMSTTTVEEGDAIPQDDETVGPAARGEPATAGTASDGTTGAGPSPSPTALWCEEHTTDIRIARAFLRRSHPDEFPDLRDRKDLEALRGERAEQAIAFLDAWFHQQTELS